MSDLLKINDKVISSNFGIGEVTGTETMHNMNFLVIESSTKNIRTLIPTSDMHSFRKISTQQHLVQTLKTYEEAKKIEQVFASKKDRIEYFKKSSSAQDLNSVLKTITELSAIDDRGSVEAKILDNLIDSVCEELSYVMKIENGEANHLLKKILSGH